MPTSQGPIPFADRGIKMQSANDAGVEKANAKATLWLPLHYTHVQHECLDIWTENISYPYIPGKNVLHLAAFITLEQDPIVLHIGSWVG